MLANNLLHPGNCNLTPCSECPLVEFPDLRANSMSFITILKKALIEEDKLYICPLNNKTCHGSLEMKAELMFAMNLIPVPTVESFLEEANKYLDLY